jgi:hypothetical protein
MESEFFRKIKNCLYIQNENLIRDMFYIEEHITPDLHIKYTSDYTILEYVVRTLTRLDLELKLGLTFTILNCPADDKEFIEWFVKFFMLIESLDDSGFELTELHKEILYNKYSPFEGELDSVYPNYNEFKIVFLETN